MDFNKQMQTIISQITPCSKPLLLLHSCCAPCSSYVLECLSPHFTLALYFYNPNIFPPHEYHRRLQEQHQLITAMGLSDTVRIIESEYKPESFYRIAKGFEEIPEGGERCMRCFRLRLHSACTAAKEIGAEFFTTTLTISPHKNAAAINAIGSSFADELGVPFLPCDFKKGNGFRRSIELSDRYGLYRQDYCGCEFSQKERAKEK